MKIPPKVQDTETRRQKPGQMWCFRLAAVLACLCVGVGLLLPTMMTIAVGNHRALPKRQLQADARTLMAAVHYLFESEPDFETNPVRLIATAPTLVQRTNDRPFEGFSNQTTWLDGLTNPPAQT